MMDRMQMITHPEAAFSEEKIYRFRTKFFISEPISFTADVFADTRYKLYLNGNLIAVGPCRGNKSELYFDSISNNEHLIEGENVLEAVVLQLKNEFDGDTVYANMGTVLRTGNIRFALKGTANGQNETVNLETGEDWKSAWCPGIDFVGDENYIVGLNEVAKEQYFSALEWKPAKCVGKCFAYDAKKDNLTQYGRYTMKNAPIPPQRLEKKSFTFDSDGVCDAGEYMTAYVKYTFSGKGKIRLTYAECKVVERNNKYVKENRIDEEGLIQGYFDEIYINGENVVYEPFALRSFRFIKAETEGEIKLEKIEGFETGYPLLTKADFFCDSEIDNKLWEVSLRTLKRCMQETYVDCPYYEQEQYLMDSRMQILYTYYVSGDDRLARRLLQDFASVQMPDGIFLARTPDILPQIIPGFALYYVFILFDNYNHFGDISLVKKYMPNVCKLLQYFSNQLSEKGLVKRSGFWNFIDWASGWEELYGTPSGEDNDELTIYTLMYATALKRAAVLQEALGNKAGAHEFIIEANALIENAKKYCFDESKMLFADGPSKKHFSAHAQLWAVLSDAVEENIAHTIMANSLKLQSQPTYGYIYDYFRALEKCGLYEERNTMLNKLRHLITLNCTTIPEEPDNPRSECHGWGAVVLYEYGATDLGVRVNEPENTIYIKPYINEFKHAKGTISFNKGNVFVEWKKDNNVFNLTVQAPKEYIKKITMPDGSFYEKTESDFCLECTL